MTFSPDGKTLAVGTRDYRFLFWEWETGKEREVRLPLQDRREGLLGEADRGLVDPRRPVPLPDLFHVAPCCGTSGALPGPGALVVPLNG